MNNTQQDSNMTIADVIHSLGLITMGVKDHGRFWYDNDYIGSTKVNQPLKRPESASDVMRANALQRDTLGTIVQEDVVFVAQGTILNGDRVIPNAALQLKTAGYRLETIFVDSKKLAINIVSDDYRINIYYNDSLQTPAEDLIIFNLRLKHWEPGRKKKNKKRTSIVQAIRRMFGY